MKKELEIKYINEISHGDLFYAGICRKLIVFNVFKSEKRNDLNYRNLNYDDRDDISCRDLVKLNKKMTQEMK